ncbi:ABC transporter substrate-binding protein [Roseibium sp. MMSF_3544]|uniref:ABC transporter substrate-binding protein n=1 Tax=unclassified Roseibium TaxID=2629323 RepID=UPI00273E0675|nr:ABC transporter substrate-binding protein [Roseibium sp. MMSF_3544]
MIARLIANYLVLVWLYCGAAYGEVAVAIGYLEQIEPQPPVLSNLDPIPENEGLAGAELGLKDNATTGRFLKQTYSLETRIVDEGGDFESAARELLSLTPFIIVKAPQEKLLALADLPEAEGAILFNASAPDVDLRGNACRRNILHTLPSRAMLTDALAQFGVRKKWTDWVVISGPNPKDKAYADALQKSAQKFGVRIREVKEWDVDADMRRNAFQELPLFTQDFPEHDLLIVADETDDFGRYVPFSTWEPRPVAGTEGLVATAWDRTVEQWGAAQLQNRFEEEADRPMRPVDYASWVAMRALGEAVTRTNQAEPGVIREYLLSDKFELAGFKGRPLTFRTWNGQMRQPIPLVHPRAVATQAPLEGFLHQRTELDTLGIDEAESACTAFGE